jgi:hypothetical protein
MLYYPFRWLPPLHLCFLLVFLQVIQNDKLMAFTAARLSWAITAVFFVTVAADLKHSQVITSHWIVYALPVLFSGLIGMAERKDMLGCFLAASSVMMAVVIGWTYPSSDLLNHWSQNSSTPLSGAPHEEQRVSYTLYAGWPQVYGGWPPPYIKPADAFPTAALGVYQDIDTVNGYSSLGHRSFNTTMGCVPGFGPQCTVIPVSPLLNQEPETHQPYLDLLKIDRISVDKNLWKADGAPTLPKGWLQGTKGTLLQFGRAQPSPLPGTVSWHSPDISIGKGAAQRNGDVLQIRNGTKDGVIVFARLFYPGFRASLDGKELTVKPVGDLLVGVEVPANSSGLLTLSFRPPYFDIGLMLATLGMLGWLGYAALERRKSA